MNEPHPSQQRTGRIVTVVLSYAAFASLWILLSDRAVALLFSDPARITMVSTLKGWAFVVVTSLLLYVLMRRLSAAPDAAPAPIGSLRPLLVPLGLLGTAILALTVGGIVERLDRQKRVEIARLEVIADLKTRQIVDWLAERQDDARFLQTSPLFADCYRRWRIAGDNASRELLLAQLAEFVNSHALAGALLLDERGDALWDSHGPASGVDPELRVIAVRAAANRQVARFGPYRDAAGRLRLDFIAPLTPGGDPPPIVVLSADPAAALFPELQSWPVLSRSGETVLFKRDGGAMLFLNQLRHRPDTALRLRVPLAAADLPSSTPPGGAGPGRALEGLDYRGVPVVGFVRAVPGTEWFLAAKADKAEMYADAVVGALWIGLAGLLALCGAGAGAFLLLQRRQLAATFRERQAREEKLRALLLLEAVVESSDDAIFAKDLEGRYQLFNRAAARVTGKPPEQVLGRDDRALFPPAEAEVLMAIGRQVVAEDRTVTNEEVLTTANGTGIFLATKGPLHDAEGNVVGHFGISRDITARKKAEEAVRENEALTRAVLDNLPIGIAVNSVDPAVAFYMNDNFPLFYRTTREKLADPDAFWNVVYEDPEFRERIRRRVLEDCASGDPQRMYWVDVPITRAGTETTYVTARNTPVPGKSLVISTVWDVTERKRAEEEKVNLEAQLLQARKMESIGRLAGGVAHDFNNMLFVILGHVAMALERTDPATPLHADLEEIRKAAQRSADLTRQLLAFARRQTAAPQVLDLNQVVSGMLKMLRRLIGEDIDLAWRPGEGLRPVKIDPAQVDQILANLCVNSRDAIDGAGRIVIETGNVSLDEASCADDSGSVPVDYVLLAVSDDGCGMGKEVKSHLFEPFYTTKEAGRGTGLGLATVYGIVKQNEGFIDVSSEPGKGTTIRIYLRSSPGAAVEVSAEPPAEMPLGRGETVLLVEDEAAILKLGAAMLEQLGYTVLCAGTAGEALRLAGEHAGAISLLVTDVVMPELNGRDLARRLCAGNPEMKCLFMSGYTADVIAHRGVLDEGVRFIQKPFSLRGLAGKVREALEQPAGPAGTTAAPPAPRAS